MFYVCHLTFLIENTVARVNVLRHNAQGGQVKKVERRSKLDGEGCSAPQDNVQDDHEDGRVDREDPEKVPHDSKSSAQ